MQRLCAVLLMVALGGCGPVTLPLVHRLDAQDQEAVEIGWNQALSPADRLDRQQLLDVLLAGRLHEQGVDRLVMQSEKQYQGGTVVMLLHFDRLSPANDRFEVFIYDRAWALRRHERYTPDEIRTTVSELFGEYEVVPANDPNRELTERERRLKLIEEILSRPVTSGESDAEHADR